MKSQVLKAIVLVYLFPFFLCDNYIAVVLFFRHGDRTPIKFVKNDPYSDESLWPEKVAQLTNLGKQQLYELGQWFRIRYDEFLPRKYSSNDIYIQSTDVDRTLMSAAANLAGLYPPLENTHEWNHNLMWQPIPIHTVPRKLDYLLGMTMPCPKHEQLLLELLNTKSFKEFFANQVKFLEYLTKKAGQEFKTLTDVKCLFDTLHVEEMHNFTLPEWAKDIYPDRLWPFCLLEFKQVTFTPELARLKNGPLICELLEHFESFINTEKNTTLSNPWGRKLTVFSLHDDTMVNLLNDFGIWDRSLPEYASSLMFELKESQNGTKYINLVYKKSATDVRTLILPGCNKNCPFEKFVGFLTPKSLCYKEWVEECYKNEVENASKSCGGNH